MSRRVAMLVAAGCVLAAAAAPAAPDPSAVVPAAQAARSGAARRPWQAWAAALSERGIGVSGNMTGLWIGDVAGGVKTGGVYNTLGFAGAEGDLEKLTGWWRGGRAFANVAWIRGGSVSTWFVGDALVVSNLDGFDSIRLYQVWLEQRVAGGRIGVRAGSLSADEEFCGTAGGAMFTNSAFGWEAAIGANVVNGGPIYYAPGLGVRVEVTPAEGWTLRAAGYDGDSFDSRGGDPDVNEHGTHFELSREQGAFLIAEVCREWGARAGQPGTLKLGAFRHTADFADHLRDQSGGSLASSGLEPEVHHGMPGIYGVFEQKLWNDPADAEQGVGGWLRMAGAPAECPTFSWVSEGGLDWTGALPGRNRDVLGIGLVTAYVSPDLREHVREANALDGGARPLPDFERVLEVAYQVRVGEHWRVTPDVQWVQHPGTTRALPDAVVATLRLGWQ